MKVYSQELKNQILKEVEETRNVAIVAKKHGIPHQTIHGWVRKANIKVKYKSSRKIDILKTPEVQKLKKIIAEKEAENLILKDLLKKTYQVWETN